MHDIIVERRSFFRRAALGPLALLLSLTACRTEDAEGTLRVQYGNQWLEFDTSRTATFNAPYLHLCGTNDPLPEAIDDERSVCIDLSFEPSMPGSGPITYTIDGTATVPSPLASDTGRVAPTFEPGPQHTPGLVGLWVNTSCFGEPTTEASVHQVSGQLVLEENSATRLKGHLELRVTGKTGGSCVGDAAEADLELDITR